MPGLVTSLFFLAFVQLLTAYTCPSNPATIKYQGQPYVFPTKGSDDHYESNQNCSWIVQVPDGFYINYGYTAFSRYDSNLETSELRGTLMTNNVYDASAGLDVVDIKMCDQFTINLLSFDNARGTFRFNITWIKKAPPAEPMVIQIADFGNNVFNMQNMLGQNTVTFNISSSTQLYLSVDSQNYEQESEVIVYDGPSVATGADYWTLESANGETMVQYGVKSTKSSLTLYSPMIDANLREYAIVNDLRNIAQYTQYGAAVVAETARTTELDVNAGKSSAFTFVAIGGMVTLEGIRYDLGNSAVLAYEGFPSDNPSVLIGTFTSQSNLPHTFDSTTVTFVVSAKSYTQLGITVASTQTAFERKNLPVLKAKPVRKVNRRLNTRADRD